MPYLDALVPAVPDPADLLERLRRLRFTDGGASVDLGPLDEATLNLIRYVLAQTERDVVLALPQGRHDVAVALGALLQLNRLGARLRGQFHGQGFDGPLLVVGLNVNLTDRLRRLKIGAENLSTALRAQRVRADGTVTDLRGTISPARAWGDGLLYLNTSLGWPTLPQVRPGLVIIDRTSFRNPDTLDAALTWAAQHHARRVLVLSTIGEPWPAALDNPDRWLRWGWTPGLRHDVGQELGRPPDGGPLSTNALLCIPRRPVALAEYLAPALTRLRRRCLSGIAAARRTHLPFPPRVAEAVQLVNVLTGTWSSLATADLHAAQELRGVSTTTLRRTLQDRRDGDLPKEWSGFRETLWPDLRRDVLGFADLLEEYNPRFEMLRAVLAWARAHRPGRLLVVRTQTRSAARALTHDLLEVEPGLESLLSSDTHAPTLRVASYSERLPWAVQPTVEIHLGVPPPWRRACLLGGEGTEHVLVVDPDEKHWADRVLLGLDTEWQATLKEAAAELNLDCPPSPHVPGPRTVYGPVTVDNRGEDDEVTPLPAFDLERMFAAFTSALDKVDRGEEDPGTDARTPAGARSALARPLTLEPGDTQYWLPADGTAEVLVGSRYSSAPVSGLTAGTTLLIPRGETREELYGRLLQAAHRDADVAAVTMVLQRFRKATWALYDQCGSWEAVARALRTRGSEVQAAQTCKNWAEGRVIAPDDVYDIRRVAWLTKRDDLTLDRTWERIGVIATELRRLHRDLGRVLSGAIAEVATGRSGENLRKLSQLCGGIDPAEVLEEFELRQIRSVGGPRSVPASQLRKLLPIEC
ncbi:hypothetical protein [uncultured Serinicoccus sp.]|uniref:DISARM anti-phage system protein DrmE domain-containing protein n=1 Tax=uncultured Serinicoccus sp. TaxID=735514 RepID=UPI002635B4F3|nr:hypothetical protein [uncultured Serinicoccus sp.]